MKLFYLTPILLFLTIQCVAKTDLRAGKDFALFIAVKDYAHWPSLKNPIKDAHAVARELRDIYAFQTEVLENPTRQEIYNVIKTYQQKDFPDDAQFFIFFSGHGEFIPESSQGFFIPKDGQTRQDDPFQDTYIPLNRLKGLINNIPCNHILLSVDACYSGTIDENVALKGSNEVGALKEGQLSAKQQEYISEVMKLKSRLFLTSGGKERTPDGVNHSPFTEKMLACLRYGIESKLITTSTLFSYMETVRPRPHWGKFGVHQNGGDFVMIKADQLLTPAASSASSSSPAQKGKAFWEAQIQKITEDNYQAELEMFNTEMAGFKSVGSAKMKDAEKAIWHYQKTKPDGDFVQMWKTCAGAFLHQPRDVQNWLQLGDFFYEVASPKILSQNLGIDYENANRRKLPEIVLENCASWAAICYFNALQKEKSQRKRKGIQRLFKRAITQLQQFGYTSFEERKYRIAAYQFLLVHFLEQNPEESKEQKDYNQSLYVTGITLMQAENPEKAEPFLQLLYLTGYDEPSVYEMLSRIKSSRN